MARGNPWTARLAGVAKFIGRLIYVAVVWAVAGVVGAVWFVVRAVWFVWRGAFCLIAAAGRGAFCLIAAAGRGAFRLIYADELREAELAAKRHEAELADERARSARAIELLKAEIRGVLRGYAIGVEHTLSVLERGDAQHSSANPSLPLRAAIGWGFVAISPIFACR